LICAAFTSILMLLVEAGLFIIKNIKVDMINKDNEKKEKIINKKI